MSPTMAAFILVIGATDTGQTTREQKVRPESRRANRRTVKTSVEIRQLDRLAEGERGGQKLTK